MNDFLNVVVEGDILNTFVNLIETVVALDLVTLVFMLLSKAKDSL